MNHLRNNKINVIRVTKTNSAFGPTESSLTLHSNLPARWIWARGNERIVAGRVGKEKEATVHTAIVDIDEKDRIVYDGVTYEIISILKQDSYTNQYLEISVGVLA